MKQVLLIASVAEAITGGAILISPVMAVHLLLGAQAEGVTIPVARVLGIALVALGVGGSFRSVWLGMWLYTALAALFLLYLGLATQWVGPLLWTAVAAHAILAVLLVWPRTQAQST